MDNVAEQLRRYTLDEVISLVCGFLPGLDANQQTRFLKLVIGGPRPRVADAKDAPEDLEDLLARIQALHDDLANDVYVEYGSGYDPEYGEYRGFGDDSWIDKLDELFAEATSLLGVGRFGDAVEAYLALFDIFGLAEDGFHFTRPDPVEALNSDVDVMKENLFVAIGQSAPEPVATALEVSEDLSFYGQNRFALLDAWQSYPELRVGLEVALIELARQPALQNSGSLGMSHAAELLRELYRRYRTPADYETLCREVGPQQGWPYEDLVSRYQQQESWQQMLTWADNGLAKLPADSSYRPVLQEARGQALIRLDRPQEAVEELLPLVRRKRTASVYLALRDAARAVGQWEALYLQLTCEIREYVLQQTAKSSYSVGALVEAGLLGYAYLLEGDWSEAVAWASNRALPAGWHEHDATRTVATGLIRMGMVAKGMPPDDVLAQELGNAPKIIGEYGQLLEAVARSLPGDPLLDGAVRVYERLVERSADGKNRDSYATAGAYCTVIRSIRRVQGRMTDFERYYQGLFDTYRRYPALKDELRKAVEGSGYNNRKR